MHCAAKICYCKVVKLTSIYIIFQVKLTKRYYVNGEMSLYLSSA